MEFCKYYILLLVMAYSKQDCKFSNETFLCRQHEIGSIVYEFNSQKSEDDELQSIIIAESDYVTIDNFFSFLENSSKEKLIEIRITNCKVKEVTQSAFEGYNTLKILDISNNKLDDMTFIRNLPTSLEELYLRKNSFIHINDVFSNLKNLRLIDLSFCQISEVDFTVFDGVTSIELVNVSNNNVDSSMSKKFLKNIKCVDISHNNLMRYDNIPSFCLDFSYTNMSGYRWYNISEKNVTVFIDKFYYIGNNNLNINATNVNKNQLDIQIQILNMSEYKGDVSDIKLIQVKVARALVLKNSNIPTLEKSVYDFKTLFYNENPNSTLDLSNNSITEIAELYFEKYNLEILNLCYNNMKLLKVNVFLDARFSELLLCHSNIETIDDGTFSGMSIKLLNLSHNKLYKLDFLGSVNNITYLDLSFNMIQFIRVDVFTNLHGLEIINLSNNLISSFDAGTFTVSSLVEINLSNNNLTVIRSLSFDDLPNLTHLILEGNRIKSIETKAFKTLPKLIMLNLSSGDMVQLEDSSFFNLEGLKTLYLNNNSIKVLPVDVFNGVPNLKHLYLQNNYINSLVALKGINLDVLEINISDEFQPGNFNIPQLQTLYITDSNIETLPNSYFLSLYNLKELRLKNSVIVSLQSNALKGLFRLQYLDPQLFNNVTVLKRYSFQDLKSLQQLNLSGLNIEAIEPEAFYGLIKLQKLYLNNNNLVALDGNVFVGLRNVTVLDISGNKITKLSVKTFEGLEDIRELVLKKNNIFSIPLGTFQRLRTLEALNLGHNSIVQINVSTFSRLENLKYLDLSHNRIEVICDGVLFPLRNLEKVYLAGNYLHSVSELVVIENFPKLNLVDINGNYFNCKDLVLLLGRFTNKNISLYIQSGQNYEIENVKGIVCSSTCTNIQKIVNI